MYFSYFDIDSVTDPVLKKSERALAEYRARVTALRERPDDSVPEYSLVHATQPQLHDTLDRLKKQFKGIKHLVLVGIGGQDLSVKAIHSALGEQGVALESLDTIAPHQVQQLLQKIQKVKKVSHIAVCISSKSGTTAETTVNGSVVLQALEEKFGTDIYAQTIFIGTTGTGLLKFGQRQKATVVPMPKIVGGRFSVGTEAGLVPLALLKHDTDAFMAGMLDVLTPEFESVVAENAARLAHYYKKKFHHYNFFAFEPRLEKLGAWYRQLQAESLGKAKDRSGAPVQTGMVPTVSTPVELHSMGQLYLSGLPGVYTDFVTFDDDTTNYSIPKKGIAKSYGKFDMQEVATAIYGGVMSAYQAKGLPYRSTIFDEALPYSLGLFMAMRMLETMYVAELLNLDAFNQPNVELYKDKTRDILGLS